jgi:hypothetical protein
MFRLFAWTPRWRPFSLSAHGLSAAANPRAALAARRGIFVRRRFSSKGRTVRAAETSSEEYGF